MNRRMSLERPLAQAAEHLGHVRVLDWAGHRAAVTYTFDDSNSSQLVHYDRLAALAVPFSFYLLTEKRESKSPVWERALRDGHELGNHSQSHRFSGPHLAEDIDRATAFIERTFDTAVWTMAAPYGAAQYCAVAEARFLVNRGVNDGLVLPLDTTNRFDLSCYVPPEGARGWDYDQKIQAARAAGGWQIFLVHGFSGGDDDAYQPVSLEGFVASVERTKSQGDVWIGTLKDIAAYWLGQRAFAEARVLEGPDGLSYVWDLPSHFPPGRTLLAEAPFELRQYGRSVVRDDAGNSVIELDARALTVAL